MSYAELVRKDGFAILRSVFSEEYIRHSQKEIDQASPIRTRAGVRHALRLAPVARIACARPLIDFAREVLGADAFPFRATLFEKTLAANWLVVWHQDTALPLCERLAVSGWGPWSVKEGIDYAHAPATALSQVLALRVHLDDSTAGNGPLRVLPGTHNRGVLSDEQVPELTGDIPSMNCVCPKGGVVAMRPLIVHASSKSHIDAPRRILHIEYAASKSIAHPLQLALA